MVKNFQNEKPISLCMHLHSGQKTLFSKLDCGQSKLCKILYTVQHKISNFDIVTISNTSLQKHILY